VAAPVASPRPVAASARAANKQAEGRDGANSSDDATKITEIGRWPASIKRAAEKKAPGKVAQRSGGKRIAVIGGPVRSEAPEDGASGQWDEF